jgi:hypothetical protein
VAIFSRYSGFLHQKAIVIIFQNRTDSTWIIARNESEALSKAVSNLGVTADQITLQQGKQLNIVMMPGLSVVKHSSTNFATLTKIIQSERLAARWRFSPGTLVSSINKTDRHEWGMI